MRVADGIVEQLIASGVQHVFGVGGANIEDLFAAVQRRRPRIRAIVCKHEHGAACAASAYARVSGGLGVVLATSGGGALNLTHALAEARATHVPLLAIVGEPPSELQGAGAFQDTSGRAGAVDARAVLGAAAGVCWRVDDAAETPRVLDQALAYIAEYASSAVILIAKDAQQAELGTSRERESMLPPPYVPQLSQAALCDAARVLGAARCVIVAGDEVVRAQAGTELARLAAALDAPVAVAPDARDAFDNRDLRFAGVAGAMGHDSVASALAFADVCLLVGTRLPLLARMGLEARLIELPVVSIGREPPFLHGKAHQHLACELRSGLRALLAAVSDMRVRREPRLQSAAAPTERSGAFDSASVLQTLQARIDDDAVVLVDAGNTGASAVHHLRAPQRGRWLIAMGMAGMGYTFGAAIGAAVASGRRCWALAGDGAFFMHGFEIHTAVEHALPITYILFDNRAHGMCAVRERLLLREDGGYNEFRRAHLARGLGAMFPGLYARECRTQAELERALTELPASGPSVISVELETLEVPPFVAFARAQPGATSIPRGGLHASE